MRRFKRVLTIYVLSKNKKTNQFLYLKIFIFTAVNNRCLLHGRVFVMKSTEPRDEKQSLFRDDTKQPAQLWKLARSL